MIKGMIGKLSAMQDLERGEMLESMNYIMDGKATDSQIGSFLTALKIKGETPDEILAGATVMRNKAVPVQCTGYCIDTCGTGGDCSGTFNISTAVMFVAAAAGVRVLKHGNRSVSSRSGSADVLEELGARISLTPQQVRDCANETGLGFMFAPGFHTAMKNVMGARRELGMRTIFNILGPLSNPARVQGQVLGVFDEKLTGVFAQVLGSIGVERAMIVHGSDGLDEITITGDTRVCEIRDGEIREYMIRPGDFGVAEAPIEEIMGGDARENANIIRGIFKGERGAKRDIVLLNAGAAIYVGKKAKSMAQGVEIARAVIDEGLALEKLESFVGFTGRMRS